MRGIMKIQSVYIIYSADVLSDTSRFIEDMSPEKHMPAGFNGGPEWEKRVDIASKFTQTEGDEQYDFGYLGKESGNVHYFPYQYLDSEATELPDDDFDGESGQGQHRKWVAELSYDEWLVFADSYIIDLNDEGMPESYEETMGSLTIEYGHIPSISVDNSEGWNSPGTPGEVIDSTFYLSFALEAS
jgi:hypothetical protein